MGSENLFHKRKARSATGADSGVELELPQHITHEATGGRLTLKGLYISAQGNTLSSGILEHCRLPVRPDPAGQK